MVVQHDGTMVSTLASQVPENTSWLVFFICKEFLQLLWLPPVRIIGNSELSLGVNVRDRLQPPMTPTSIDGWKGYMIVDEVSYF